MRTSYEIQLCLKIAIHVKDHVLLESIREYFGGIGSIHRNKDSFQYEVSSLQDIINTIIPHFDKYPLITQKFADYHLWKEVANLMQKKEHLTPEGLSKILNIKASINKGLSDKLKESFSNINPVLRPEVKNREIKDPNWMSGFVEAEGCFNIAVLNYGNSTKVQLRLIISQHVRDEALIKSFVNYFGVGLITKSRNTTVFYVSSLKDNNNIIIPFFVKYPLYGVKLLDFINWKQAAELIKNKEHLTDSGLKKLKLIKEELVARKIN